MRLTSVKIIGVYEFEEFDLGFWIGGKVEQGQTKMTTPPHGSRDTTTACFYFPLLPLGIIVIVRYFPEKNPYFT